MPSGGVSKGTIIRIALEFLKKVRQRGANQALQDTVRETVGRNMPPAPPAVVRKFSDYIFKDGATHGKDEVFRSLGFSRQDSEFLASVFQNQANRNHHVDTSQWTSSVHRFIQDDGRRVTIPIDLERGGRTTSIMTAWAQRQDGTLSLLSPFLGYLRR